MHHILEVPIFKLVLSWSVPDRVLFLLPAGKALLHVLAFRPDVISGLLVLAALRDYVSLDRVLRDLLESLILLLYFLMHCALKIALHFFQNVYFRGVLKLWLLIIIVNLREDVVTLF